MKNVKQIVWSISIAKFKFIVTTSNTIMDIIRKLGFETNNGGCLSDVYKQIKLRIKFENIDISHIILGRSHNRGKTYIVHTRKNMKEILIENSSFSKNRLKQRLIKENYLQNKCIECGLETLWNNKKLVLQLDHINGISNDNRIENLRMLCPNCHSQTETYCGRKNIKHTNMNNTNMNKLCHKCKITKELKDFSNNRHSVDGKNCYCKKCESIRRHNIWLNIKQDSIKLEKNRERNRLQYRNRKKIKINKEYDLDKLIESIYNIQ